MPLSLTHLIQNLNPKKPIHTYFFCPRLLYFYQYPFHKYFWQVQIRFIFENYHSSKTRMNIFCWMKEKQLNLPISPACLLLYFTQKPEQHLQRLLFFYYLIQKIFQNQNRIQHSELEEKYRLI